jgi:imidazole glycerol-phosphate synthase subunit HisH
MLSRLGHSAQISSDIDVLAKATKLILPGVGHFAFGMQQLEESGIIEVANYKVLSEKIPVLGICLGAQLMCRWSEEGDRLGLGWAQCDVKRFVQTDTDAFKVPHMGWSSVLPVTASKLFQNAAEQLRFYHVHSFHMANVREQDVLCTTNYGYQFVSGIEIDNVIGVQFHPEKSHRFGMSILDNFAKNY